MKAIDLVINSILPEDLRSLDRSYDKKSIEKLMSEIATKYPERYAELVKKIADVGRDASYWQGETITLDDLKPPVDTSKHYAEMDAELDKVDKKFKGPARDDERMKVYARYADLIEKDTMAAALKSGNNIAYSVMSGARGNVAQMKAMLATPALYTDYKDRPINKFVRRSFGEGVRPADYLAGAFGVRRSVLATKNSTADAGDLLKQAVTSTANLIVTTEDCGAANGLVADVDDKDTIGRVLAASVKGIPAGTVLSRRIINQLREKGVEKIQARSALTCQAKQGVCAHCLGTIPGGKFAPIGYAAGITAAQAVGEPLTQGALNCLVEGTLVRMADWSVKPIERLLPGEHVLGCDNNGNLFPVAVIAKWNQGVQQTYEWRFRLYSTQELVCLSATTKHPILTRIAGVNSQQKLENIDTQNLDLPLARVKSATSTEYFACDAVEQIDLGQKQCWDISVAHKDSLFILANGISCHNTKHTGGIFKGKKTYAGLDVISQILQSPETFPHRAAVAEIEGRVEGIEAAPQGGTYITVAGQKHYALPGHEATVKVGDTVEAGDQLSDGIVDVNDVVRLRGLGEGRKYYVNRVQQALEDSGGGASKRNLEVMARGALDHIRITSDDGLGDYLPDDLASYNSLSSTYAAPETMKPSRPDRAVGKYLHAPALHYTIGTKLTSRMAKELQDNGVAEVQIDDAPPPFTPEMVRLRGAQFSGTDWLAKQHSSNLGKNLVLDAERGRDTDLKKNVHFVPRLAVGVGFGENAGKTGEF